MATTAPRFLRTVSLLCTFIGTLGLGCTVPQDAGLDGDASGLPISDRASSDRAVTLDVRGGADGDGLPDASDNCPAVRNAAQLDEDEDEDGCGDACDNCPVTANNGQTDTDHDGIGDACEGLDSDDDGIADGEDNCPQDPNARQVDAQRAGDTEIIRVNALEPRR